ncbi:MAG: hypothetical protein V2I82_01435, partial [Halieaceae bacterium]|nr:hypothetical protein [Halieaceae bacterium]
MLPLSSWTLHFFLAGILLALAAGSWAQENADPQSHLDFLRDLFFLEAINEPFRGDVRYHLVPLGAVQKVRGKWTPRESERVSG